LSYTRVTEEEAKFNLLPSPSLNHFLGQDDLGDGGDDGSLNTGNAGGRVACGLVEQQSVSRTAQAGIGQDGEVTLSQSSPQAPVVVEFDIGLAENEKGDNGKFEIKVGLGDCDIVRILFHLTAFSIN
jgi:hypothetical protein